MFNMDKFKEQKRPVSQQHGRCHQKPGRRARLRLPASHGRNFMAEEFKASFDEYSQTSRQKHSCGKRRKTSLQRKKQTFTNKLAEHVKAEGVITGITEALPRQLLMMFLLTSKGSSAY